MIPWIRHPAVHTYRWQHLILYQPNCGSATAVATLHTNWIWYGHTQQHAEWRNKTLRILIGHILDQVLKASVPRNAAFLSIYTRIDKSVDKYQLPPKTGPTLDDVQRRTTIDNDTKKVIQDLLINDQPIGYNWRADLPTGTHNITTRLYWEPIELGYLAATLNLPENPPTSS